MQGLPWKSRGLDSALPRQGPQARSCVRCQKKRDSPMKTILLKGKMQNEHTSKLLVPFLGPPVEAIPGTGWGPTTPTAFSVPLHSEATSKNTQTKHSALAPETSISEKFLCPLFLERTTFGYSFYFGVCGGSAERGETCFQRLMLRDIKVLNMGERGGRLKGRIYIYIYIYIK